MVEKKAQYQAKESSWQVSEAEKTRVQNLFSKSSETALDPEECIQQ